MDEIEPLTSEDKQKILAVKNAYSSFWDHIKFKKGWAKPCISKEEVDHLLNEAAKIVVRIRKEMDKEDPTFKLRMLEGNAREYLWTVTRHCKHNPQKFIRDIVHATFKDANGYVEGLTAEKIDQLIEKYSVKKLTVDQLQKQWEEINEKFKSVLFNPSFQDSADNMKIYQQISNGFSTVLSALCDLDEKKNKVSEPPQEDSDTENRSESESKAEPEEPEPQQPVNQPNLIIQKVSDDVGVIKTGIKSLAQASEELNLEELSNDSKHADMVIKDLNQKCLVYTEDLMKDLLNLDQVVLSQEEKPLRKAQVNNIQGLLNDVDTIKQKLLNIRNELKQRENEKLKRKKEEETKRNEELKIKQEEEMKRNEELKLKQEEEEKKRNEEEKLKQQEEKKKLEEEQKKTKRK